VANSERFPIESAYDAEPAFNPWLIRLPILAIIGGMLWIMIIVLAVMAYWRVMDGRILPGVHVYGVNVGGMSPAQAQAAVESAFTYDDQAVFTFREPQSERFWQYTARDLGVTFAASDAVDAAYQIGREATPISSVVEQTLTWLNGRNVSPIVQYDQAAALAALERIAAEIERPAIDARLIFDGASIQSTPGQVGRVLDRRSTLARLDAAILSLTTGAEIPLLVTETTPVAWDAEVAASRAMTAISAPIILTAEDAQGNPLGPWTISTEQIAALVTVETNQNDDGTLRYDVSVNTAPFRASLEALAPGLLIPQRDARYHFDTASRSLLVIQSGIDQRTLDIDATLQAIEAAIFSPTNRIVPLVFQYTPARYHNNITAQELGITELIAEGISSYAGSPRARIDNILLSAARFDGLVIAPGETFSFNRHVGDITPEAGYVASKVIYGDRTIDGVGGGVCQVSTTAFRAAFYAGYPFTEWHAHSYRVGYYEGSDPEGVGMDAAIYVGELDLRFINDTPYHLLIEASVSPASQTVHFRFYSTSVGRRVIKQGPTIVSVDPPLATRYEANSALQPGQELWVDWAAEGAFVEIGRLIVDENGNTISRQSFNRQYQPWGAIIQVAPGDFRLG
jgi:vancomycin resistance protein YoaR